jgi:hypothetical protein
MNNTPPLDFPTLEQANNYSRFGEMVDDCSSRAVACRLYARSTAAARKEDLGKRKQPQPTEKSIV